MGDKMKSLFEEAIKQKLFSQLDCHVARFLTADATGCASGKAKLLFIIAYLSAEMRAGHVCVALQQMGSPHFFFNHKHALMIPFWNQLQQPSYQDWLTVIQESGLLIRGQINAPLVLYNGLLYFQRMWLNEQKVSHFFLRAINLGTKSMAKVSNILDILFGKAMNKKIIDWQKIAVALALTRRVTIISGGPGTGKTTTVAKLLAALVLANGADPSRLRIMAAAPTGKAAARLTASLHQAVSKLAAEHCLGLPIPKEAVTLHRLLGAHSHDGQAFLHHKGNPLHLDILIIDEASMIDLSMMAAVIDALPVDAKFILLGDREQLASVEAGSVLGDLCRVANGSYSKQCAGELSKLTGYRIDSGINTATIADNVCLLQKSYRFNENSGIHLLATYVRQGKKEETLSLLQSGCYSDIKLNVLGANSYRSIVETAVTGYRDYLQAIHERTQPSFAMAAFDQFRVLAALREGKYGVRGLNQAIECALAEQKLIDKSPDQNWYLGRPIMILKNNPGLKLCNGDIGITLYADGAARKTRVYFQLPDGQLRGFSPYLLPEHETAFVMTVHKSQGSEFDQVAFILPEEYTPLLTRSLLYTAITRAKKQIIINGQLDILAATIESQIERRSGLGEQLTQNSMLMHNKLTC